MANPNVVLCRAKVPQGVRASWGWSTAGLTTKGQPGAVACLLLLALAHSLQLGTQGMLGSCLGRGARGKRRGWPRGRRSRACARRAAGRLNPLLAALRPRPRPWGARTGPPGRPPPSARAYLPRRGRARGSIRRRGAGAHAAGARQGPGRDRAPRAGLDFWLPPGFSLGSPGRFGAARRPRDAGCL